jgi:PST family polysaccharide transporter
MSFVSTLLSNFLEIDIRNSIENRVSDVEAGHWTAMTFISRNYFMFASSLFTLYVIPKFAQLKTNTAFRKEVLLIYKTLLPLFGLGMLLVFFLRFFIVDLVYPTFQGMESLFKWQLLGDFVKIAAIVIAHQFLAKRMVKQFVFTEFVSLVLFYLLAQFFITDYGVEGVVIAHFVRYIIYFILVIVVLRSHFFGKEQKI